MFSSLTETGVCAVSLISDCALATLKYIFGKMTASSALITDAAHSCADALTSLLTLFGTLPRKNAERQGKAEKYTIGFIFSVLLLTGFSMLLGCVKDIVTGSENATVPLPVCAVSVFSFLVKECLFFFSRHFSKKLGSAVLFAQAYHHRSDALSCVGSFAGILGSSLGMPVIDKVAAIVISIMIMKSASDIAKRKNDS